MRQLLLTETFDTFQVHDATITTFCTFRVDGAFRSSYFGPDGAEQFPDEQDRYAYWERVRPFFLGLTRGKHTPLKFQIVFRLSDERAKELLLSAGSRQTADLIDSLLLNIRFEDNSLTAVTGVSLKQFSMDRTAEFAWDEAAGRFLKEAGIPFTVNS